MILPGVPPTYQPGVENERNRSIDLADRQNRKTGQDVEIGGERLILTSPNGTRWSVTVSDLGVLSTTSL